MQVPEFEVIGGNPWSRTRKNGVAIRSLTTWVGRLFLLCSVAVLQCSILLGFWGCLGLLSYWVSYFRFILHSLLLFNLKLETFDL